MHSINTDTRQVETVPGLGGRGGYFTCNIKIKTKQAWANLAWFISLDKLAKKKLKRALGPPKG